MALPSAGLQNLGNLLKGKVNLLFAVVEVRGKPNAGPGAVVDQDIPRQEFTRHLACMLALHRNGAGPLRRIERGVNGPAAG